MKKILASVAILILATGLSWAVRAPRTPFTYTQPDGSVITLVNHGDEFHHWTTHNGQLVEMDERGFYRPASIMAFESRAAAARGQRLKINQDRINTPEEYRFGEKHFLVILIEFDDLSFSVPEPGESFDRMLNQQGYSEYGCTGSARDYFIDNSDGQFRPVFDVYGPVKVSKGYAYYGNGRVGDYTFEAISEACTLLDDSIDFSLYDIDGDGEVDNVFVYYAGYNASEGGPSNTIWPHHNMAFKLGEFDGLTASTYACTSELHGNKGTTMAGIGLFVHEFCHVLGLPDFYDTSGDEAWNPEEFSIMSDGHCLNEYRTPASLNSLERLMLGWYGDFPILSEAGPYELGSLSDHHLPWVLPADIDGEQFILEMRDGTGWDAYLPKGMVIYHMDASENRLYGYTRAIDVWTGNISAPINDYDEHPCFYAVPSYKYGRHSSETMIFPGTGNVTEFNPVAWSGHKLKSRITDISVAGDRVHFNLTDPVRRMVTGTVSDSDGKPIEGALVTMILPERPSSSGVRLIRSSRSASDILYSTTTLADGSYEIELDTDDETSSFVVCASKEGYIEQARNLELSTYGNCSFVLRPAGSPVRSGLMKYDPDSQDSYSSMGLNSPITSNTSIMGAIYYPRDEIACYSGMEIRSMTFCTAAEKYEDLYAFVIEEDGKPRMVKVESQGQNGWFTVDLSGLSLTIIGNKGLFFGYGLRGDDDAPLVYQNRRGTRNGLFYSYFSFENPFWYEEEGCALVLSVDLYDPAASKYISLSAMGFTSIDNPRGKEGYSAGDTFTFRLLPATGKEVSSTVWLYDGTATSAPSVELKAGKHTVTARVTYGDGSREEITLELEAR